VKDLDTELTRTEFVIRAIPASSSYDLRLELWGATRKCELLEEVLGVPVRIEAA
jgi:hypothetical protein